MRKSRVFTEDGDYTSLGKDIEERLVHEMEVIKFLRKLTSKSVTKDEFKEIIDNAVDVLIGY